MKNVIKIPVFAIFSHVSDKLDPTNPVYVCILLPWFNIQQYAEDNRATPGI